MMSSGLLSRLEGLTLQMETVTFQTFGFGQSVINIKPVPKKVCVLYDGKDGRVLHAHRVLTMPGGHDVSDEELETRARDMAKRAGHDIISLSTLRVPGGGHDGPSHYQIDLATNKLKKLERPPAIRHTKGDRRVRHHRLIDAAIIFTRLGDITFLGRDTD